MRTKKVEVGLHTFLLIEKEVGGEYLYYVHLAGRGGLDLTFNDLDRLKKEAKTFKRKKNAD
jgi:hypothetical protein